MKGCKNCPAYEKCTVTYRGSSCAALRSSYGLDSDPEITTNADLIRAMNDEKLATDLLRMFEELCEDGIPSPEYMRLWLQHPAEEGEL